eukprot:4963852-Amphidinium_carterae.1
MAGASRLYSSLRGTCGRGTAFVSSLAWGFFPVMCRPLMHLFSSPIYGQSGNFQEAMARARIQADSWTQRFARGGLTDSSAQEAYRLVVHTARATPHKGADLKLATGTLFCPLAAPFQTFDPHLWVWRVMQTYKWQHASQPIAYLEALA